MKGWREILLSDLGSVVTGNTPPSKKEGCWGSYMLFITPTDYKKYHKYAKDSERQLSAAGTSLLSKKILPSMSVLVTCIGSDMGKVVINSVPCVTNQQINSITVDRKICSPDFLYYILCNMESELKLIGSDGSAIPILNKSDFSSISIPFPSLTEQKAIAAVLSSLDDKIDLLHRQNATLEAMAEALFKQWFVVEAKKEWEEGTLGNFAVNIKGTVKPSELATGTVYLGLEHIERKSLSQIRYGDSASVSSNKYSFQENDILFGKLRPYFHKVCMATTQGVCSTDILVIRPRKNEYFCFCLFAFFQNDVVEYTSLASGGTRMPRTDWNTLKAYPIVIPDNDTLKQFDNLVRPTLRRMKANILQIRTLEKLRDALLPKLMSGEVRVEF